MRTDPLADMLSMIKNANMRGYERVVVDHSKLKERVAAVLKEEGYLKAVQVVEEDRRAVAKTTVTVPGVRRAGAAIPPGDVMGFSP